MNPEDEKANPNQNPDESTSDNPPPGDEAVSLADAMWGDKAGEDTVLHGEPAADGEVDNADKDAAGEGDDADADAAKPEGEAAKDEAAEKDDVSDEEIVKGLGEKAQKRFRELVNSNKEMEQRLTGFMGVIEDAQVTPQDVVDLFAYGKAIRTGDFDTARAILAEQARQLELVSGKAVELGDPLSDYPDLKAGVDNMELTRDHALELARVRRQTEETRRANDAQSRQQEAGQAYQQAAVAGFNDVKTLAAGWAKSDLDWKSKEALMVKRAGIIQQTYPPQQWGAMMKVAYDEITETLKAARPAANAQRQHQALRPNAMGGGAKAPGSLHEAMWGEPETT